MKEHFGEKTLQFITAQEFLEYSSVNQEIVNEYLMKVS
jgi:hypothetical protein